MGENVREVGEGRLADVPGQMKGRRRAGEDGMEPAGAELLRHADRRVITADRTENPAVHFTSAA
jgi:hypothetical protein